MYVCMMANIRKYDQPKHTDLIVETKEYREFVDSLPRSKSFNDAINEYMKSANEERKKELALTSPDNSAVKSSRYISYIPPETNKVNATLDNWIEKVTKHEIVEYIDKVETVQELAQIQEKGYVMFTVARKRKQDLLPAEKYKNEMEKN